MVTKPFSGKETVMQKYTYEPRFYNLVFEWRTNEPYIYVWIKHPSAGHVSDVPHAEIYIWDEKTDSSRIGYTHTMFKAVCKKWLWLTNPEEFSSWLNGTFPTNT